jgi:hypothetical protein
MKFMKSSNCMSIHLGGFAVKATDFPARKNRHQSFATIEIELADNAGQINFFVESMAEAEFLRDAFALIQAKRLKEREAA